MVRCSDSRFGKVRQFRRGLNISCAQGLLFVAVVVAAAAAVVVVVVVMVVVVCSHEQTFPSHYPVPPRYLYAPLRRTPNDTSGLVRIELVDLHPARIVVIQI